MILKQGKSNHGETRTTPIIADPKHKQGDRKQFGKTTVQIMRDNDAGQSFGGIRHYAIIWSDNENPSNSGCGWIPCFLFDSLS